MAATGDADEDLLSISPEALQGRSSAAEDEALDDQSHENKIDELPSVKKSGKQLMPDSPIFYFKLPPPAFSSSLLFPPIGLPPPPPSIFRREDIPSVNAIDRTAYHLPLQYPSNGRASLLHHWSMPAPKFYSLSTPFYSNAQPGGIYSFPSPHTPFYRYEPPLFLSKSVYFEQFSPKV